MFKRSVLVVGLKPNGAGNQFTRYLSSLGFRPHHLPSDRHKRDRLDSIPEADSAICVTSNMSHGMFHAVNERYKSSGRRVWTCPGGISQIKESFEDHYFGQYDLKLRELSKARALVWILAHNCKVGGIFTANDLFMIAERFLKVHFTKADVKNTINRLEKSGNVHRCQRPNSSKVTDSRVVFYEFQGLSEKEWTALTREHDLPLEQNRIKNRVVRRDGNGGIQPVKDTRGDEAGMAKPKKDLPAEPTPIRPDVQVPKQPAPPEPPPEAAKVPPEVAVISEEINLVHDSLSAQFAEMKALLAQGFSGIKIPEQQKASLNLNDLPKHFQIINKLQEHKLDEHKLDQILKMIDVLMDAPT